MRLRHLEVFHAVMQAGSISGAAQLLFVTQPAVSKVLQHCEMQLGIALFSRIKGRLYPTPEALRLFDDVDRIYRDLQGVRRLAQGLRDGLAERVRLLSTPALAMSLLPLGLKRWRLRHPEVQCKVSAHHTKEIVAGLLLGEADFALSLQDPLHPGLICEPLACGPMTVIAPARSWSAAELQRPMALQDLPDALISMPEDDPLGSRLAAAFEAEEMCVRALTVVQTYPLVRSLVEAGLGMAVVDPFTAASAGHAVQARVLAPRIDVPLYLLRPASANVSRVAQELVDALREAASECLEGSGRVLPFERRTA